ncbi:hypothetical protein [Gluconobacter cerinus]|uniref:hypothetical protein n=1 Tax=Gluconobacter cerinus TaxID=38307 RepID=UPI001B8B8D88|nr:hypothetical protein [Gluconobacter cerinus]MBS0995828.1 hypothetical protein [Gluconobacter cerinus]
MKTEGDNLTSGQRYRLEALEKTLLAFRREVGTALLSGAKNQNELELHIGMLQYRIGALAQAGEVSAEECRKHARRLIELSEQGTR